MMLGRKWKASYDRHELLSQVRVLSYAYNCNGEMFECNVTSGTIFAAIVVVSRLRKINECIHKSRIGDINLKNCAFILYIEKIISSIGFLESGEG
jgi:hypothetical protein